ncbi:uncharacterized protein MONOS_13974 [Monocercomonoides exilis]|uniref:uncharacterized protein n=1 Tax=Monocercomonoides exilis TaxID=2049356 RepID=UPI00355AAEEE|nr:hypothetical protein MONOS_13974 [Monocercomonoides exilis]|eukprot:MONOS_13974.1-p1 / transcript=MONOS_13974.1 / gene=MONOS_13974 / organism=Monocercomonoides_exilis_PA203 / gene_product=unspecified product / transcript_product=unspecified product / location=Mono_scaffold00914:10217-10609(+) / protein_length=131 / sequence_SO=supercontig / SO=protein_coding / is_pseudo=false
MAREGVEVDGLAGGVVAGEEQDYTDKLEDDSTAEREAQPKCGGSEDCEDCEDCEGDEAGEEEGMLGSARRSGECGRKVETSWSVVSIDIFSSLICAYNGMVPFLTMFILPSGQCEKNQEKFSASIFGCKR